MKAKPYIGITGPTSAWEVKHICKIFSEMGYSMETPHVPMIGFLVCYKSLNAESMKNKRYPSLDMLPDMLRATDGDVLNMIHYYSGNLENLSDQVVKVFDGFYDEDLCRALQLNIDWPDIREIGKMKDKYPDMQIVFQASRGVTEEKSFAEVASGIRKYGELLDYVLIDPSGGKEKSFDINNSVALYSELRYRCPNLMIGFAGGLTEKDAVSTLRQVVEQVGETEFCTDAEGGVRDKLDGSHGNDLLSIKKVEGLLQAESQILK